MEKKFLDLYQTLSFGTVNRKEPATKEPDNSYLLRAITETSHQPVEKRRKKMARCKDFTATELFSKTHNEVGIGQDGPFLRDGKSQSIRKANRIFTWGEDIPEPLIRFDDLKLSNTLLKNLRSFNISIPSPVQMQTIPLFLDKRNILVSAPTGSGKTIAFILPIVKQALDVELKEDDLFAVFVAPTAVLAEQIYACLKQLTQTLPLKSVLVTSGAKPDVGNFLVCTPSKFINGGRHGLIKKDDLEKVEWVVVDEADRLFDTTEGERGFRIQLGEIFNMIDYPVTKRAFFSATFSAEVERWCKDNLTDIATVCIGPRNTSNSAVTQELKFSGDEHGKMLLLEEILREGFDPPAMIFVQSKERAGELFIELKKRLPHLSVRIMSSEFTTEARTEIMDQLKTGRVFVLICTEVMGRGIDIPTMSLVINFDLPSSVASYIHRVGRTGRAGRTGKAITFYSYGDIKVLRPIASIIKQAGYDVPEYIFELKTNRDERRTLKTKAPNREALGSIKKWGRVKKEAIKKKIMTGKSKFIKKKVKKTKADFGDQKPLEKKN